MTTVAIVGAGLAGLVVARHLQGLAEVTLFEKSRGVGGRMSTRYADDFTFDHGAQFFTVRSPEFSEFLRPLHAAGVIADWPAQFAELDGDRVIASRLWSSDHPHLVGTPRMNCVGQYLSTDLDVRLETTVARVERNERQWAVFDADDGSLGQFDWLILTAPPPQTERLVGASPEAVAVCRTRTMHGCFALMLGFEQPLELPWQAALVHNADISWVSVNSSKPGRSNAFTMVIHSTNAWADAHMEQPTDEVLEYMVSEASRVTGQALGRASHRQVHRWRYANIDKQDGPAYHLDNDNQFALSGDWFVRGRVEAAFASASKLGWRLRRRLQRDRNS